MTMKVIEHKVLTSVKTHPNEARYPFRNTHELIEASRKLMGILSDEEKQDLLKGELIVDEEDTIELYDEIKEDDIIGLATFNTNGFTKTRGISANLYSVSKIHHGDDFLTCKNIFTKEDEIVTFQDVSVGLAMNLAEILYRDDKPYACSTEEEWTIKIQVDEENAEQVMENIKNPIPEEKPEELSISDCYYSFKFNDDEDIYYVVINSKEYWNNEDKNEFVSTMHLAEKFGFEKYESGEENSYLYDKKYSTSDLKTLFSSFSVEENKEM